LPAKRQRELLEMLACIEADWEWHLAGEAGLDPGYADSLRERIRQLGLTRRVVWHGSLPPDELAGLMAAMDLFVSYSAFESYGMALAEAAAFGLPILTTDVGEAERLVENGGSRGLVIPVDRADLFEQALTKLLRDGAFRRSLEATPSPLSSETV
jgi:glycosyltransferase involved in cell wall biosynthesis